MLFSAFVLFTGRYLKPATRWVKPLPKWRGLVPGALIAVWTITFIFLLPTSIFTLGMGSIALVGEFLRLTIVTWEISGIMLALGAVVFTASRGIAIWHALAQGGRA
jgi:hypothetical protein